MINTKRKNQNIFPIFFYGMIFSSKLFFAAGGIPAETPELSRARSSSDGGAVRRSPSLLSRFPVPSGFTSGFTSDLISRARSVSPLRLSSPLIPAATDDPIEDLEGAEIGGGSEPPISDKEGDDPQVSEVGAIPKYLDILLVRTPLPPSDETETPEKPTFEKPILEKIKPFIERILFDKNEDKIKLLESTKSELEKLSKELTNSFAELLKDLSYPNLSSFSKLLNSIEEREELIKALYSFNFICNLNSKSEEQEEMSSEETQAEIATEEEITKFADECKKKLINSKGIIQEDSTEINKLFSLSGSLFDAFLRVANVLSTPDLDGKELLKKFKNSPELANFKFKDFKDFKDLEDLEDLEEGEINALITRSLIIKILDAFFGEGGTAQESRKILKEMLSFSLLKRKLEEIIARMKNEKVVDKKAEEEAAKKKAEAAKKKAEAAKAEAAKKKAEAAKAEAAKAEAAKAEAAKAEAAKAEAAKAEAAKKKAEKVAASPSNTTNASIKPTKPSTKSWISKATENIPLVSGVVETIEEYILSPINSLFSTFSELFQSFKKRFFG